MTTRDDLSRIADLVAAQGTEADRQSWARLRAHLDDLRRRLDAAGGTLRAPGMNVCGRCRLEWRDPDGVRADCPRCRAEARFRGYVRQFEDAVLAEVGRRRAEAARAPRDGIPPESPPVVEADLHAAGEIGLAPDRDGEPGETVGPAFLVRFDSREDMGRAMRGAPIVARWPWDRRLVGRDEGAIGPGEDEA